MNPSEATVLLSAAAAIDNRKVNEITSREWARALDGLQLEECLTALRQFRRQATSEYLMPGHIRERVRIARDEAHAKAAIERGLPSGPPATDEARAQIIADAKTRLAARRTTETALAPDSRPLSEQHANEPPPTGVLGPQDAKNRSEGRA
jgi:hypothetical protein